MEGLNYEVAAGSVTAFRGVAALYGFSLLLRARWACDLKRPLLALSGFVVGEVLPSTAPLYKPKHNSEPWTLPSRSPDPKP